MCWSGGWGSRDGYARVATALKFIFQSKVAWGHLQQEMLGNKCQNEETYEKALREAWGRVDQGTINKLVDNHNQQMQKFIQEKGGWTKY